MRIAGLLTEFLYQKKYLNIPGIGKFSIDENITIPDQDDKTFEAFLQNIRFEQKSIPEMDESLIDFIRAKTGKIRPLAIADLDSLLSDYKGFLNLGKPLFLDGIGNLNKLRSGKIEFTPGAPAAEHIDLYNDESAKPTPREKKEIEIIEKIKSGLDISNYKKPLIIIIGVSAFVLVLAGGYYIYQNTENTPELVQTPASEEPVQAAPPVVSTRDTSTVVNKDSTVETKDTVKPVAAVTINPPAPTPVVTQVQTPPAPTPATPAPNSDKRNFKFVLQKTSRKEIAFSNFSKVRIDRPDIRMETKDSIMYKIFLVQSCAPSDTARIKESLNVWYWGKKEPKVTIEN